MGGFREMAVKKQMTVRTVLSNAKEFDKLLG